MEEKIMRTFFHKKIGIASVSVFFSLLLFLTAMSSSYKSTGSQVTGTTETYSHTVTNVPIDLKYDSDKYFISGYSYETEVYLTSVNRIKLDSEINADTRNFKVVADLTQFKPGKQTVTLKLKNLPSGVSGVVNPKTLSVTIGKKKTKNFLVKPQVDSSQIAAGYEIKSIKSSIEQVEVTSDEATIQQIDHVIAKLPETENLTGNYIGQVTLQAVSANGTILASVITPAKSTLTVKTKKLTKSVPVILHIVGDLDSSLSDISYKLNKENVTISGSQDALDNINQIDVNVDVTGITKDTVKTVNLSAENVVVEPSVISAQLTIVKK